MNTLTNEEAAYIAGFVDGEGSITYSRYVRNRNHKHFQLSLSISNTNQEVLEWICTAVGLGNVRVSYRESKTRNQKTCYQVHWYHQEALGILRQFCHI
jgi:hypothetical protein